MNTDSGIVIIENLSLEDLGGNNDDIVGDPISRLSSWLSNKTLMWVKQHNFFSPALNMYLDPKRYNGKTLNMGSVIKEVMNVKQ